MSEPEVIVRVEGAVGRLTLNRPQALHALNTAMCQAMVEALLAWQADPGVRLVLLDHAGDRGFCAGGDIRVVAQSGAGDGALGRAFFRLEYQLNELLHRFPKPGVVIMDGVTMGGGVGIARPFRYRVATERTLFAMPETGIGLFPDVGGGWYLPRMPGHIGLWLALTGARLKAADCELVGIATDYVASGDVAALKAEIIKDPEAIETLLTRFEADAGRPPLAEHQDEIARLFSGDSVEAIVAALHGGQSDWARAQLAILETRSPQAMKVAFRQLQHGAQATSFAAQMVLEYAIAVRVLQRHDFIEGVRALIVDKDSQPQWDPPTLAAVSTGLLDGIFAPLPSAQAWRPLP